jgi:hypothetical protein
MIVRRMLGVLGLGPAADRKVEIAVLRHQLVVLRRPVARPRYAPADQRLGPARRGGPSWTEFLRAQAVGVLGSSPPTWRTTTPRAPPRHRPRRSSPRADPDSCRARPHWPHRTRRRPWWTDPRVPPRRVSGQLEQPPNSSNLGTSSPSTRDPYWSWGRPGGAAPLPRPNSCPGMTKVQGRAVRSRQRRGNRSQQAQGKPRSTKWHPSGPRT